METPSLPAPNLYQNIKNPVASLPLSGEGFFSAARLPCAKNSVLIAIAKPACRATTKINKALLVCLSVALSTG
jgi:hypothetical protein